MNVVLTIAGSDSGGGAGIQADLKTFEAHGVFGISVVTALTAQNTQGVRAVHALPASFILKQLNAIAEDFELAAVKIGMLHNLSVLQVVAEWLVHVQVPVVLDPVMIATSGDPLISEDTADAILRNLAPRATLITPNVPEACTLLGIDETKDVAELPKLALDLHQESTGWAVLLKGGHLISPSETQHLAIDYLVDEGLLHSIEGPYYDCGPLHGTGCTYSAAIAANLALGMPLLEAVRQGKRYISEAIRLRPQGVGRGATPLRHRIDPTAL
jgi:hydroxymethylpyrimidine/phosphomethylpyrimidine kinase